MDTTTQRSDGHTPTDPGPARPTALPAWSAAERAAHQVVEQAQELVARVETSPALDGAVDVLRRVAGRLPVEARRLLGGESLGHPAHPMMTDLPIGFWTSSFCLDLLGGRRASRASTAFVAAGVLTALPAAATGLVDWTDVSKGKGRVGIVHMAANLAATTAYTASFLARVRGRRGRGIALGMLGATLATAGGYLGGHLAFGQDHADDVDDVDGGRADPDRRRGLLPRRRG